MTKEQKLILIQYAEKLSIPMLINAIEILSKILLKKSKEIK